MPFSADTDTLSRLTIASKEQNDAMRAEIHRLQAAIAGKSMFEGDPLSSPVTGEANYAPAALDGVSVELPDPEELRYSLEADQASYAANQPPELTPSEKNKVFQYYKEMMPKFQEGLLSHGQLRDANSGNVEQYMRHQEQMGRVGVALGQTVRILDPDAPFSLDSFRPTQPNYRNMREWYNQFDNIKWASEQEVEQQKRSLDDETYMPFLVLYAKGVDSSVIKRKLSMSATLYEACVSRFKDESDALAGEPDEAPAPAEFDTPSPRIQDDKDAAEQMAQLTKLELDVFSRHASKAAPLIRGKDPIQVADVRREVGISQRDSSALLRSLVKHGFVTYDPSSRSYLPVDQES